MVVGRDEVPAKQDVVICIFYFILQTATPHRYHPGLVATLVILSLFCEESGFLLIDPSLRSG